VYFDRSGKCECPFDMSSVNDGQGVVYISSKECLTCDHCVNIYWDKNIVECSHKNSRYGDVTTIKFCGRRGKDSGG